MSSSLLRHLKALSDETRLRLMHLLGHYELSVNELVSILEMGQSRVSRHLKILAEADLVRFRRDGLWVFYSASQEGAGHDLMRALEPFRDADPVFSNDVTMAASIIEDRSLKTRQFFNAIAEHWDTLSREVLGGFDLAGAVADALPPDCKVAVDLGCGTGTVLERLKPHVQLLIGVDGSPRMLEMSRRRFGEHTEHLSLRIGELEHLPLRDEEADFACINMVLHHLSEPDKAVAEIHRILAPGGLLVITDFDRHEDERMRADYGDRWLGFDESTLGALLEAHGFTVRSTTPRPVERGLRLNLTLAERL